MKIAVSYLGVKNKNDFIKEMDKTDVDFIHVDVMDGKYVKKKVNAYNDVLTLSKLTKKRLDVHFMVNKPSKYIDNFANLNVSFMSFHLDTKDNLNELIKRAKMYGIKVGLVLNPKDNIEEVFPYLEQIDLIMIMTVEPGLPGQALINDVIPKIFALKREIKKRDLAVLISADGGINLENNYLLKGCDILVCGSCISKSSDYQDTITKLRVI